MSSVHDVEEDDAPEAPDDIPEHAFQDRGEEGSEEEDDDCAAQESPTEEEPVEVSQDQGTPHNDYWRAAIACLPSEQREAAWRFFTEREMNRAPGATDTFSGLLLLMQANGLFMDSCARRISDMAAEMRQTPKVITSIAHQSAPDLAAFKDGFAAVSAQLGELQRNITEGFNASAALQPAAEPRDIPPKTNPAAVWIFAATLALIVGAAGAYFSAQHFRAVAALETREEVRKVKTWLDVTEQAQAVLLSRKAKLSFDLVDDAELKRKVYTLKVEGAPILKAGTKDGVGFIAFQ